MNSLLLSRRDVDFLLFEWLDVTERLTERPAFADHSRQTFDAALDTYSEIAHAEFAPHNKKVDREPPRLVGDKVVSAPEQRSALQAFAAGGTARRLPGRNIGRHAPALCRGTRGSRRSFSPPAPPRLRMPFSRSPMPTCC